MSNDQIREQISAHEKAISVLKQQLRAGNKVDDYINKFLKYKIIIKITSEDSYFSLKKILSDRNILWVASDTMTGAEDFIKEYNFHYLALESNREYFTLCGEDPNEQNHINYCKLNNHNIIEDIEIIDASYNEAPEIKLK